MTRLWLESWMPAGPLQCLRVDLALLALLLVLRRTAAPTTASYSPSFFENRATEHPTLDLLQRVKTRYASLSCPASNAAGRLALPFVSTVSPPYNW